MTLHCCYDYKGLMEAVSVTGALSSPRSYIFSATQMVSAFVTYKYREMDF